MILRKFTNAIHEMIPECMRYKLPKDLIGDEIIHADVHYGKLARMNYLNNLHSEGKKYEHALASYEFGGNFWVVCCLCWLLPFSISISSQVHSMTCWMLGLLVLPPLLSMARSTAGSQCWDIELVMQPPNSPDTNIVHLIQPSFSIQSIQYQKPSKDVDELIQNLLLVAIHEELPLMIRIKVWRLTQEGAEGEAKAKVKVKVKAKAKEEEEEEHAPPSTCTCTSMHLHLPACTCTSMYLPAPPCTSIFLLPPSSMHLHCLHLSACAQLAPPCTCTCTSLHARRVAKKQE